MRVNNITVSFQRIEEGTDNEVWQSHDILLFD